MQRSAPAVSPHSRARPHAVVCGILVACGPVTCFHAALTRHRGANKRFKLARTEMVGYFLKDAMTLNIKTACCQQALAVLASVLHGQ